MAGAELLPSMNWKTSDSYGALMIFQKLCIRYFKVQKIPREEQANHIILYAGNSGEEMIEASNLTEEDMNDPDKVWDVFQTQVKPKTNKYVDRLRLRKYTQKEIESSDEFLNRCETQAKKCKFTEAEHEARIIEQFMEGVYSNDLQKSLIMEGEDMMCKAIDIARSHEATIRDNKDMRVKTVNHDLIVDAVGYPKFARAAKPCNKCGRAHKKYPPQSCPAYGARCNTCGKMNHWQKMCLSVPENKNKTNMNKGTSQRHYAGNKVHRNFNSDKPMKANRTSAVHEFSQDDPNEDYFTVSSVIVAEVSNSNDSEALRSIKVRTPCNKTGSMTIKVDTGAGVNLLPIRAFRIMFPDLLDAHGKPKTYLTNNHQKNLIAVNNMKLKHFGSIKLKCTFDEKNWIDTDFYIYYFGSAKPKSPRHGDNS
ncbi:uncharacterized protein LOC125030582 [Penaeus chinensis]|uniref:uncharacterized protein LOC125030582 n=1 Tax=Penaeus chinensis TaxID=139456 RepID=UPI001FB57EF5|nr:uncharacterized protein LOC125030582 [Penaeus chinensis]